MQDPESPVVLTVTTTVGSLDVARSLARKILAERLAACVQIDPAVLSLYRWKGELCEAPEVRLVIKTLPACEAALRALFARHHPYELPQFLATGMHPSAAYGEWVHAEVGVPPG